MGNVDIQHFTTRKQILKKKIFILALAISLSMANDCRAQKIDFRLFDNTALSDSTRLNYIIINREGRSAKDLYSDYFSVIILLLQVPTLYRWTKVSL